MAAALGAVPPPHRTSAPTAGGAPPLVHRQRAATDSALSGFAAPGAGHQRRVAGARHLDENRSVLQGPPQCLMGERREPGRPGRALPVQLSRARNLHTRDNTAHNVPWRRQTLTPSLLDERLRFHGTAESTDEQAGSIQRRAQRQDRTRMTVGGVRLLQPVVPVVPDDRQPKPVHRGEGRRPGADDHPGSPQQESQERPITARRTVLGREHHHRFPIQVAPEPGCQGLSLMGRCHHDDGAARARQGGLDGSGQAQLPRQDHRDAPAVVVRRTCFGRRQLGRQGGPDRAWSLTVSQPSQELLTTVVRLPAELT